MSAVVLLLHIQCNRTTSYNRSMYRYPPPHAQPGGLGGRVVCQPARPVVGGWLLAYSQLTADELNDGLG